MESIPTVSGPKTGSTICCFFYSLDITGKPLSLEKEVMSGTVKYKTASASICGEGMGSSESTTAQPFSMSSDPVTIIEQRVQHDTSVPRVPDNDDGSHSEDEVKPQM